MEPAVQLFANYAHGRTRTTDAVLSRNDVEIFDLSVWGSSVRNLLQAKASGIMSAAMNFVTNRIDRISKQN